MYQEELDILDIVAKDPLTSQRQIAALAGISLGQVNFLMKKFAAKGLVKIEGQTAKSLQYHLTPQGMAALTEKTLRYMKSSYKAVIEMTKRIADIAESYKEMGYEICVAGSKDEMMELCKLALGDAKIPYKTGRPEGCCSKDGIHLENPAREGAPMVILCWEEETEEQCAGYICVNLLKQHC